MKKNTVYIFDYLHYYLDLKKKLKCNSSV